MLRRSVRSAVVALSALAVVAPTLAAQTPQAILERYNKAVDPQGRIASVEGIRTTVTMELPAMGMSMTVNSAVRRPNQIIIDSEIPGVGAMRQGYDGATAWSVDPMQGPRILSGLEAAALVEGTTFNSVTRSPDLFSAMELAAKAQKQDAYRSYAATPRFSAATRPCAASEVAYAWTRLSRAA